MTLQTITLLIAAPTAAITAFMYAVDWALQQDGKQFRRSGRES